MKNKSGFTLAEVIIVIVIVGILSIISVPIYRNHVAKSIAIEGEALLTEIMTAQEIYAARNKAWFEPGSYTVVETSYLPDIGVDARRNKYFRKFGYTGDLGAIDNMSNTDVIMKIFTTGEPETRAEGISLTLEFTKSDPYKIIQKQTKED